MGVPPLLHTLTSVISGEATATTTMVSSNNTIMVNTTTLPTLNSNKTCHNVSVGCECGSTETNNATRGMMAHDDGSLDALLYIVVVLLFYAFSIVVLMVKYIRRENKEAYLRQYFDDFVAREQFSSPMARNQICMKTVMDKRKDLAAQHEVSGQPRCGGSDCDELSSQTVSEKLSSCEEADMPQLECRLSIPETICELVEGGEKEEEEEEPRLEGEEEPGQEEEEGEGEEFDFDERELLQLLATAEHVETDNEQVVLEGLLPRRETPV